MKAIALVPKKANSIHLKEIVTPKISSKEVLIKTIETGVDGTDFEINQGLYGQTPKSKNFLVLGHESIGRIVNVGSAVKDFKTGDIVVPTVRRPCQECINCKNNESDMCLSGKYLERGIKGLHGYFSEFYKECPKYLVKVPKEFVEFAVLTEPLSIAEKAVMQIFKIQERMNWKPKKTLIIGMGTLGILASCLILSKGIEVFAYARKPLKGLRRRICKTLGVKYFSSLEFSIKEVFRKIGCFDIIIEAAGYSPLSFQSLETLNTNGVLCLTGITGGNTCMKFLSDKLNLEMVLGNKLMFGTVNSNKNHFEQAIKDFKIFDSKWSKFLETIITRKVNYSNFKEAFMKHPDDIKTVISF